MQKDLLNKVLIAFAISTIVLIVAILPNMQNNKQDESFVQIINFTTDKKTYSSFEEMKIFVKLISKKDLENVTLKVWGIKPRNYAYINESKTLNLKKGENEIIFLAKTPYCTSGCGGVYPGPYDLFLEVESESKIVAKSSLTINLISHYA